MQRNRTIDIMKGIGILAVIAGHCTTNEIIRKTIYSFHMPLFFIIGGYFFKQDFNLKAKLRNDIQRLVTPYIYTSIIWMIILFSLIDNKVYTIIYAIKAFVWGAGANHTSLLFSNVPQIGATWFLLALFWCRIIYNYLICTTKHPIILIIIISIAATIIDYYYINIPFAILPGISAMVFYCIGNIIKQCNIKKIHIALGAFCWAIHMVFSDISLCTCYYGIYPVDIIGAVFGTYIIFKISTVIKNLKIGYYIESIGNVSLIILCIHTLEKKLIDFNTILYHIPWIIIFIFESLICILISLGLYKIKLLLNESINK